MKTISFFSYKGGAGRSTLAFNTIPLLAKEHIHPTKESPMIVVDMDIDSCGMSYLLQVQNKIDREYTVQRLLGSPCDIRKRTASIAEHPFLGHLIPVGHAYGLEDNDAILLLPAADGQMIDPNRKSNFSESAGVSFEANMESFLKVCDVYYDVPAVIFDSAVGNTATANVSNNLSDIIICCMRPTIQFTGGTFRYLAALEGDGSQKLLNGQKHIVLVPNVIPENKVTINEATYPNAAVSNIRNNFITEFDRDGLKHIYHFEMLDRSNFGIPAVDRFMWCEGLLHNLPTLNPNEETALRRYYKLAELINNIQTY